MVWSGRIILIIMLNEVKNRTTDYTDYFCLEPVFNKRAETDKEVIRGLSTRRDLVG
jgi:hypothetical protein